MNASEEAARGLTDIERFLYRQAHLEAARRRVEDFTARAPGLTKQQRFAIERWYLAEQRRIARLVTEHIADSINVVEEQHRIRFGRWLRGTLTAMVLITAAMGLCVAVVLGTSS
ncbi:hypothetical protein [Streptomyces sp. NPDC002758]